MRVWTVSEDKAGTLTQCLGVASHLTTGPVVKLIERLPRWRMRVFPPHRRKAEVPPDVLISCGFVAERHIQLIKAIYKGRPMAVHLQPPRAATAASYDHAFVSRHDWSLPRFEGPTYHSMIGVPHRVTRDALASRRESARHRFLPEGSQKPIVAMLLGGPNGAYDFSGATIASLVTTARRLCDEGWRVLVSTSRRSPADLLPAFLSVQAERIVVWDRIGENPYLDYLAAADAFIITKDSVTMHFEALTSGRPVYTHDLLHRPGERLDKFEWLHRDLQSELKLTRPFIGALGEYGYEFPDQARLIADTIRDAFVNRHKERAVP